jgi:hypothetical protein
MTAAGIALSGQAVFDGECDVDSGGFGIHRFKAFAG